MNSSLSSETVQMRRNRLQATREERTEALRNERETILRQLDGEFEVRRKSPFFKTLTGVAFVLGVGFSLSAKFGGLTSISWPKLIFGIVGMGLFLRYVVYRYSSFNIETLATTDNLNKAIKLKNKYDLKADEREENANFWNINLPPPSNSPLDILVGVIIAYKVIRYDMNTLGINKCDIYDVERNQYVKYKGLP